MRTLSLNRETLEYRKELSRNFEQNKILTNIKGIDDAFGYLIKGSVYAIAAATGVGKTTFLLATAKDLAKRGKKVLFLTIEMNIEQLLPYLPDEEPNLVIGEFESWDDEMMKAFDIICYDYLGARLSNWDELINEADALAEKAKEYNIVIFTAMQARPEIINAKEEELHTNYYVSFSKGVVNKLAGAAYLVNENSGINLYVMKNRYAPLNYKKVPMTSLDYTTKSWNSWW